MWRYTVNAHTTSACPEQSTAPRRTDLVDITGDGVGVGQRHDVGGGLSHGVVASLVAQKGLAGVGVGIDDRKAVVQPPCSGGVSLSLCMIVKNEEQTLGRCLDSVAGVFPRHLPTTPHATVNVPPG